MTYPDYPGRDSFGGETYLPEYDLLRLSVQTRRVAELMRDGKWRTLQEIHAATNDPEASISARLRDLRKPEFGKHQVFRARRGDPGRGVWEYRLVVNESDAA